MTGPLLAAAGIVALIWTALAARILIPARRARMLGADPEPVPPDAPAIDCIVPAHDEEAHVEGTVMGLLAQTHPRLRLIVVDDQSTDATGSILDRLAARPEVTNRLRVLHGVERPAGWVGKTWAVHQGYRVSGADWLLFVDADMRLDPRAVATAWTQARRDGADLVSLLPSADLETFWQAALAESLGLILATLYPLDRVNNPATPTALAAGGFILVRRVVYERAGGHEAVRNAIVEDVRLAHRVKAAGGRLSVHAAPDLARTHMYGSFAEIWRGLRKNAYAGMDYQFHKFVAGALFGLAMAWLPVVALATGLATLALGVRGSSSLVGVGLWGWLAQAACVIPLRRFLRLAWPYGFALPIGLTAYTAIATASVWHHHRGRVLWKGRAYDPRSLTGTEAGGPPR